jgi:hypothetical protein
MTHAYWLSGLKLESDFSLPALARWEGPDEVAGDVAIRRGEVSPMLDRPDHIGPIFQTRGRSEYLLALPGTGRILVRNGNEVTIDPETGADDRTTSAVLTGTIQAVLWHQRGLLPLQASAVTIGGRAVALCGPPASGKSTLAAMLAAKGCAAVADGVCLVDVREGEPVSVLPGCTRLRLWADALERLGIASTALPRALTGRDTFFLDCGSPVPRARSALGAVVVLSRGECLRVELERVRGTLAVNSLYFVVHSRRPAAALGRGHAIFAAVNRLSSAGATIWVLRIPSDPSCLAEAAARVLTATEG